MKSQIKIKKIKNFSQGSMHQAEARKPQVISPDGKSDRKRSKFHVRNKANQDVFDPMKNNPYLMNNNY